MSAESLIQSQPPIADLLDLIVQKRARIAVLGLGYVGLPLLAAFLEAGFPVVGIDISAARLEEIRSGRPSDAGVVPATIRKSLESGALRLDTSSAALAGADVVVICVPTPLTRNQVPDLSYVEQALAAITPHLRPHMLVVLESTTYPGTTDEVVQPALERSGLLVGKDIFAAFSPERVDPGNLNFHTRNTPKLVAGVTPLCTRAALALYASTVEQVVTVSSPRVAEMAKIFENTYRAVNIALVNELAMLCDRMGFSIWDVIDAAATKPFGLQIFRPGPGVGGHCIPLDPFYLSWKAKEYDMALHFIELAGEVNRKMPHFVLDKVTRLLSEDGKPLKDARICVLGVAYKSDIADTRESPAVAVLNLLAERGADAVYHDPYVPELGPASGSRWVGRSLPLGEALADSDCVVLATDHRSVDYDLLLQLPLVVLDTRNALAGRTGGRARVVPL